MKSYVSQQNLPECLGYQGLQGSVEGGELLYISRSSFIAAEDRLHGHPMLLHKRAEGWAAKGLHTGTGKIGPRPSPYPGWPQGCSPRRLPLRGSGNPMGGSPSMGIIGLVPKGGNRSHIKHQSIPRPSGVKNRFLFKLRRNFVIWVFAVFLFFLYLMHQLYSVSSTGAQSSEEMGTLKNTLQGKTGVTALLKISHRKKSMPMAVSTQKTVAQLNCRQHARFLFINICFRMGVNKSPCEAGSRQLFNRSGE